MGTNGDPARDTICFWNGDDQGKYYFYWAHRRWQPIN
jgi:hypothetical protein